MQGKKLRIFISHRHDDLFQATDILAERAGGKIEFLFAPENIADGQEWYKWIGDNAPNADIFFFIYTTKLALGLGAIRNRNVRSGNED